MSELNTRSADAHHWAEQMVKTAKANNYELDEEMLAAWLANYWAAVHDPLQFTITALRERVEELEAISERIAQIRAHRACGGEEHDPSNGKIHGFCVVCLTPFPCEYVGSPLTSRKATW